MTATNHALTGAVIALAVKKPELAIPLAFLSHFAVDVIPHYNPSGVTKYNFTNYAASWAKKVKQKSFHLIFFGDLLLLAIVLVLIPQLAPPDVSPWTILFSSLAAISPDFQGAIYYMLSLIGKKVPKVDSLTRFHIWLQWMEKPWGIWVELVWAALMVWLIHNLIR